MQSLRGPTNTIYAGGLSHVDYFTILPSFSSIVTMEATERSMISGCVLMSDIKLQSTTARLYRSHGPHRAPYRLYSDAPTYLLAFSYLLHSVKALYIHLNNILVNKVSLRALGRVIDDTYRGIRMVGESSKYGREDTANPGHLQGVGSLLLSMDYLFTL